MLCFILGMMVGGAFGTLVLLFFMGACGTRLRQGDDSPPSN